MWRKSRARVPVTQMRADLLAPRLAERVGTARLVCLAVCGQTVAVRLDAEVRAGLEHEHANECVYY